MATSSGSLTSAFGFGVATASAKGRVLDVRYFTATVLGADNPWLPSLPVEWIRHPGHIEPDDSSIAGFGEKLSDTDDTATVRHALAAIRKGVAGDGLPVRRYPVATFIDDLATAPVDAHDIYLRLHLLSNRSIRPHGASLDGMFGLLTNVAWTNLGPIDAEDIDRVRASHVTGPPVQIRSLDKFPPMTDYVVPSGVRIADASRVRLGAHLSAGTTVMHEGFCNFNAGTLGASMVEGRITAGVVVGADSDIGGGSSIMGTLSGGGTAVVSVGERCLLGANAGLGISLGDGCTVEAGLYLTAGTVVRLPDGTTVKARQLSGESQLLFRRHSQTGSVEAISVSEAGWTGLNTMLHAND